MADRAADHGLDQTASTQHREEAAPMTAARALALSVSEVAFFSPPPYRPSRSERRTREGGIVTTLLRTIRRGLAHATEAPVTDWMPRIRNYPY